MEIVKANGLNPLLRLLQSPDPSSICAAVSCVRNLTAQPPNNSPIIKAGFLQPLVNLLSFKDNENTQWHAATALNNLAANAKNRREIVNAGVVQSIKELVLETPVRVQIQMAGCIKNLSLGGMYPPFNHLLKSHPPLGELNSRLSEIGISEVLILLTNSPNREVQRKSNAALQNLRDK